MKSNSEKMFHRNGQNNCVMENTENCTPDADSTQVNNDNPDSGNQFGKNEHSYNGEHSGNGNIIICAAKADYKAM